MSSLVRPIGPLAPPILVVGAGTTGLTLACELARHGAPVRIVDRLAGINPHCRATTLHSRTLEIFHDLGIAEAVAAEAPPLRAFNHYADGRRVSRDELGHVDSPYPYSLSLEQNRTEAILEALLERLGVRVERRTELLAMAEGPDAVRATLRDPDGREEIVDAPWLVGCDGAHSTVRHQTHQAFPGAADPHQYAIADVVLAGPIAQDEAHAFLTDAGVLYMFPLPRGRVLVAADLAAHHDGATEAPTLEEIQSLVAARGPVGTRVSEPRWLSYFRIHYRLARHYGPGPRVFLAGDAVHVHSPVGGHGMNAGIQDAYNLGWKLALVARGLAAPSLLETYEAERRAVAEDLVKWTRTMTERSEAFAGMSPARRERLYVNVVVPDAEARRIARHSEELDLDYRRSAICVEHRPRGRARAPRGLAGARRRTATVRGSAPLAVRPAAGSPPRAAPVSRTARGRRRVAPAHRPRRLARALARGADRRPPGRRSARRSRGRGLDRARSGRGAPSPLRHSRGEPLPDPTRRLRRVPERADRAAASARVSRARVCSAAVAP